MVLNATAFSARRTTAGSPLDAAGAPVLQLVLAGSARDAWAASSRGLSPTDLAMQVVLPELDGRLLTGADLVQGRGDAGARRWNTPARCTRPTRTASRWRPTGRPAGRGWPARRAPSAGVAIVLSDYPGVGGQVGHAVGLDTLRQPRRDPASCCSDAGYALPARRTPPSCVARALPRARRRRS